MSEQGRCSGPMATLPPASLLFILTPEEPGAWAGGSSSEAGRAASKAGQSWTPLPHRWEHLFTHDGCPQPPPSMRKDRALWLSTLGAGCWLATRGKGTVSTGPGRRRPCLCSLGFAWAQERPQHPASPPVCEEGPDTFTRGRWSL